MAICAWSATDTLSKRHEAAMMTPERREARLRVVQEHVECEQSHELERLVATFGDSPEWHHKSDGQVLSGHASIRGFYGALFQGFPDFWLRIHHTHVTDDAVILEGELGGTHKAEWMQLAPTGRTVTVPFCALFTFTDDDRLKSEIVYYDRLTLLTQLGVA
jgi:steroid delta-isomerase-like uncharacterized protein